MSRDASLGRKYEIDMCSGPIFKKMLRFTLPLMASGALQLLFNAADIVVVGRFAGDNSLAAVGSTGSLVALFTNLFLGLSIGANVIAARYYGAKDQKALSETVHTAIMLSLISGLLLTLIGECLARQMLELMRSDEKVIGLSTLYLRVYFLGMTAMMVYNFSSAILRAAGDTRRPLYYLIIAGFINVVLNVFFVVVLKMDVAGVATATAVSQCVSAALVVRCLLKHGGAVSFELRKLRIHRDKLISIIRVGIPAGIQGVVFAISNVIVQSSINSFGATLMAGSAAANNIEAFFYVSLNAFHQATVSFTSQNYGAGESKRINRVVMCALACAFVVGTALGNIALLFGDKLLGIYSKSEPVIREGLIRMTINLRFYAVCGMMDVMAGAVRGIGYSIMPMMVSMLGACGTRLLWIYTVFAQPKWHTTRMLFIAYPISWAITFCAHLVCFLIVKKKADERMRGITRSLQ